MKVSCSKARGVGNQKAIVLPVFGSAQVSKSVKPYCKDSHTRKEDYEKVESATTERILRHTDFRALTQNERGFGRNAHNSQCEESTCVYFFTSLSQPYRNFSLIDCPA
jgi:hypothetical protein